MFLRDNTKKVIFYTALAGSFFYLGVSDNKPEYKPEPIVKRDTVYVVIQSELEKHVEDEIRFRIRRNNKVDEEFYFGIDLDIFKEKYDETKEWIRKKLEDMEYKISN